MRRGERAKEVQLLEMKEDSKAGEAQIRILNVIMILKWQQSLIGNNEGHIVQGLYE